LLKKLMAGRVAARPGEAGDRDQAGPGLRATAKTIGIVVVAALAASVALAGGRGDHGYMPAHQVSHQAGTRSVGLQPVVLRPSRSALDGAGFPEALAERRHKDAAASADPA